MGRPGRVVGGDADKRGGARQVEVISHEDHVADGEATVNRARRAGEHDGVDPAAMAMRTCAPPRSRCGFVEMGAPGRDQHPVATNGEGPGFGAVTEGGEAGNQGSEARSTPGRRPELLGHTGEPGAQYDQDVVALRVGATGQLARGHCACSKGSEPRAPAEWWASGVWRAGMGAGIGRGLLRARAALPRRRRPVARLDLKIVRPRTRPTQGSAVHPGRLTAWKVATTPCRGVPRDRALPAREGTPVIQAASPSAWAARPLGLRDADRLEEDGYVRRSGRWSSSPTAAASWRRGGGAGTGWRAALVDVIGLEWHKPTARRTLEHVISDDVEAHLVRLLGDRHLPPRQPHPGSHNEPQAVAQQSLASVEAGSSVRLERISEEVELDTSSLLYLDQHGFIPVPPGWSSRSHRRHAPRRAPWRISGLRSPLGGATLRRGRLSVPAAPCACSPTRSSRSTPNTPSPARRTRHRGSVITWVGPAADAPAPAGAVRDVGGLLMPGW